MAPQQGGCKALHGLFRVQPPVSGHAVHDGTTAGKCQMSYLFPTRACSFYFWLCTNVLLLLSNIKTRAGGHDFRLEYRRLGELREALAGVPFLALTATAAPRVRDDIMASLRLRANARRCGHALPQMLV